VNDDCDAEAKEKAFWQYGEDKRMKVVSMKLSDAPWALWIGDEKVSTQVRVMMYNHTHEPQAVKA
jgi:hypothetical protein